MSAGRTVNALSQHWSTPPKYVDAVRRVFDGGIDLDPCSNEYSVVGATTEYRLPENDGLKESWDFARVYVNPPYGADRTRKTTIKHWLKRCAESHARYGSQVLALVPVATNTKHWKDYVWGNATAVAFLYDTRLKFLENGEDKGKGAPMSCAMIYWGEDFDTFKRVFIEFGAIVDLRGQRGERMGYAFAKKQDSLFDQSITNGNHRTPR